MYSSDDETTLTSSEIDNSYNDDNNSSSSIETEVHNSTVVAVPSTSRQSLNTRWFISESTSDVDQDDVLSTDTDLCTSVLSTSEESTST